MTDRLILAADIGGTHVRAALVDATGRIVARRAAPTPTQAEVPEALIDLIGAVGTEGGELSSAVVGLPGGIDYATGRLLWVPHLPDRWTQQLSRESLSSRLGLTVHVANDADLAAVGEAYFGAGTRSEDVAYLTISTGIGAGVVLGGRLLHGRRSLGEVGHTVIDRTAWQDRRPSTLEELGSGSGVARQALDAGLGPLTARDVGQAAAAGEPQAMAIWQSALAACAVGVTNLIMAFSPGTVVVGGGLGRRTDFFTPLRELVERQPQHFPDELSIVESALGDDAGLVGAAAWNSATGGAG